MFCKMFWWNQIYLYSYNFLLQSDFSKVFLLNSSLIFRPCAKHVSFVVFNASQFMSRLYNYLTLLTAFTEHFLLLLHQNILLFLSFLIELFIKYIFIFTTVDSLFTRRPKIHLTLQYYLRLLVVTQKKKKSYTATVCWLIYFSSNEKQ